MHNREESRIVVTCNRGLAPSIIRELGELGMKPTGQFNTGVELMGSMEDCICLNLRLRSASQIMYSLHKFRCSSPDDLYRGVRSIAWDEIIDSHGYFTVNCNVSHPTIRSSMFANVKVKDAIVDSIRSAKGHRPDSGPDSSRGVVVYLYWREQVAEIFIDTSGETLAKHGYRKMPGRAPMVEALAAGVILAGHWDRRSPLVNPMCGSGTLAIEAALMATGRFPGLYRESYAFEHLLGYNPKILLQHRQWLTQSIRQDNEVTIIASDICPDAIRAAKVNAEAAEVADKIEFTVCDFRETRVPQPGGVLLFNPEYGERLGIQEELVQTYADIGNFMKQKCGGYWGYVFTGNLELGKRIGLKPSRRLEFVTAQMDCRLLEFELYAGTKKMKQAV